jgi:hypothetical protein
MSIEGYALFFSLSTTFGYISAGYPEELSVIGGAYGVYYRQE